MRKEKLEMIELTPFPHTLPPYNPNLKRQTRKMEATKEKRARDVLAVMQERDEVRPCTLLLYLSLSLHAHITPCISRLSQTN